MFVELGCGAGVEDGCGVFGGEGVLAVGALFGGGFVKFHLVWVGWGSSVSGGCCGSHVRSGLCG